MDSYPGFSGCNAVLVIMVVRERVFSGPFGAFETCWFVYAWTLVVAMDAVAEQFVGSCCLVLHVNAYGAYSELECQRKDGNAVAFVAFASKRHWHWDLHGALLFRIKAREGYYGLLQRD
jgi:hypothetical protein